ncbi:Chemotaxis regulator - transmits chemoreceptor signals to flagelllar motor components CheY [Methylophaga frappieri]|uniref:Chemotaxis regulator-transmits chemoreceptor signals to flagelllar motor components CheY n=1 Tax=Methylophaga frappieri (strain ATCC BAA-2434 / DSM 25690 / JAM7) TaxID=754477 RepID=I1YKP4_METFJ|nr:response regulator [Methylophaga frappieri]AFJ03487.1 Chemotaxis regulator - transmits chemoreceptor signals to flagelllar motor components CheY [Methylophaga frappieri]
MIRILTVDDSASLRQMMMITLQNAGFQVTQAEDGQQAMLLASSQPFDLVLTDYNMPIMNGPMLIERLRTLPGYTYTPMLLLTTETADSKKAAGRAAGATGWIQKPVDGHKLLDTIDKLLNG